jgi:hypothetical protein
MPNVNSSESNSNTGTVPQLVLVGPSTSIWIMILGAFFGLITLLGLFTFAYLSSVNPLPCSSFVYELLAGGFALGAALAGGFIGGGAGAQGRSDSPGFNLVFGVAGGAGFLIVTLVVFSMFAPMECRADVQKLNTG